LSPPVSKCIENDVLSGVGGRTNTKSPKKKKKKKKKRVWLLM
jgi:hypothetical protein